jgi:hypothetical protein
VTDWTVESYIGPQGRSPVEEFLDRLPAGDRARIDHTIGLLKEFGLQLGRGKMERGSRKLFSLFHFPFSPFRFPSLNGDWPISWNAREHHDKDKSKPPFRRVS